VLRGRLACLCSGQAWFFSCVYREDGCVTSERGSGLFDSQICTCTEQPALFLWCDCIEARWLGNPTWGAGVASLEQSNSGRACLIAPHDIPSVSYPVATSQTSALLSVLPLTVCSCSLHQLRGAAALLIRSHCACSASTARQSGLQQAPGGPSRGSPRSRAWGTPSRRWQPRPRPSRRTLTASRCERRARRAALPEAGCAQAPVASPPHTPVRRCGSEQSRQPWDECEDSQPVSGPAHSHCHSSSTAALRAESDARVEAPRNIQQSHWAHRGCIAAQPAGPAPRSACMCSHLCSSAYRAMHRKGVTGGHGGDGRHNLHPAAPAADAACARARRRWSRRVPRRHGSGWCGPWQRRRPR
jgi:hypothetical protein